MASADPPRSGTAAHPDEVGSRRGVERKTRYSRRHAEARSRGDGFGRLRQYTSSSRCVFFFALCCASLSVPTTANAPEHAPARRLTTSTQCRASLAAMIGDVNWIFMNQSQTRWCRIKLENVMARCCELADFANQRGEGCNAEDCIADCQHSGMSTLCADYFGKPCTLNRVPFRAQAAELTVMETFCVPSDCNNNVDLEALIPWFSTSYKAVRGGWHLDYDEGELNCPSDAVQALLAVLGVVLAIAFSLPILWFLCVAPKERGRTLVSQADMQGDDEDDEPRPMLGGPGTTQDSGFSTQGQQLAMQ